MENQNGFVTLSELLDEQCPPEGIQCQRFGTNKWNRIPYKEAEQRLNATPVFSALKINSELGLLDFEPSDLLKEQETTLSTIANGLPLLRKAIADGLKAIANQSPSAAEEIQQILTEGSRFRQISDNMQQLVSDLQAETIRQRRHEYIKKNETLSALRNIPSSRTHIFDEKALSRVFRNKRTVLNRRRLRTPEGANRRVRKWLNDHSTANITQQARSSTRLLSSRPTQQIRKPGNYSREPARTDK